MLLYEGWPEGRKKTLLIAAAAILAPHLHTEKELVEGANYRILQMLKGATEIASAIMHKIDSTHSH